MTGVLMGKGNFGDRETRTRRTPFEDEDQNQGDGPTSQGTPVIVSKPLDAERPGTHPSLEPSAGTNTAHTLILAFWPPGIAVR